MANRIDDNRLLPCPFCGEPAAIWYFPTHDRPILKEAYYVGCTNDNCGCELEHPGGYKSLDDAVCAWNRRYKAPEQEPILDKIYADIQRLRGCSCSCSDGIIDDVEDILDKYKAEKEQKE